LDAAVCKLNWVIMAFARVRDNVGLEIPHFKSWFKSYYYYYWHDVGAGNKLDRRTMKRSIQIKRKQTPIVHCVLNYCIFIWQRYRLWLHYYILYLIVAVPASKWEPHIWYSFGPTSKRRRPSDNLHPVAIDSQAMLLELAHRGRPRIPPRALAPCLLPWRLS
jgi:hypothetical protein